MAESMVSATGFVDKLTTEYPLAASWRRFEVALRKQQRPTFGISGLLIWLAALSTSIVSLRFIWTADKRLLWLPFGCAFLGALIGAPAGHAVGGRTGFIWGGVAGGLCGFVVGSVPLIRFFLFGAW